MCLFSLRIIADCLRLKFIRSPHVRIPGMSLLPPGLMIHCITGWIWWIQRDRASNSMQWFLMAEPWVDVWAEACLSETQSKHIERSVCRNSLAQPSARDESRIWLVCGDEAHRFTCPDMFVQTDRQINWLGEGSIKPTIDSLSKFAYLIDWEMR